MSVKRVTDLLESHGFTLNPRPGFLGFSRTHNEVVQYIDFFRWSNKKNAESAGIPRTYLVLCISRNGERYEDSGRWRLPLVEWPSDEQPVRKWSDVVDEFNEIFMPLLDSPETPFNLDERYHLV